MRTFVICDIHGNDDLFRKALKTVSLKKSDELIILGDFIDRGKNSKGVLDTILLLRESGFNNIICIRGNHEQMLLDSYLDENREYLWVKNGGDYTLQSFRVNFANEIPKKYIELIESFPHFHVIDKTLFVHAGLNFNVENPLEDLHSLLWIREINIEKMENSKYKDFEIIHGHTPTTKAEILREFDNGKIKCLDNGVYLKGNDYGSLTIAELKSKKLNFIS